MLATFETLSDDILTMIFRSCGDISVVFRAFHGLNQRLNTLLTDQRSYRFADLLYVDSHGTSEYRQYCQALIACSIQDQFKETGDRVRSLRTTFETVRRALSPTERTDLDNQLRTAFLALQNTVPTVESLKQIDSLIITRAARLQCDNHQYTPFNFAKAVNQLLLRHLNNLYSTEELLLEPITRMLQLLIVSNTDLLMNRDHTDVEESATVWYFLFYAIYQLQYWYYTPPGVSINMRCYLAVLRLLLVALQCQKQTQESLFDILKMISERQVTNQKELFIQGTQWEILKIVVEENACTMTTSWEEKADNAFSVILPKLIERNRLDVILLLYRQLQQVRLYFDQPDRLRRNVNILTGSPAGRQLFRQLLHEKPLPSWLTSKALVFLLLGKKERQFLGRVLHPSSSLVHAVDEDGNNPLLYVCLKVRGCRHRLVQYLINIGCDVRARNYSGENYADALQLQRNRRLREDLLENELVKVDDVSDQIQVINTTQ